MPIRFWSNNPKFQRCKTSDSVRRWGEIGREEDLPVFQTRPPKTEIFLRPDIPFSHTHPLPLVNDFHRSRFRPNLLWCALLESPSLTPRKGGPKYRIGSSHVHRGLLPGDRLRVGSTGCGAAGDCFKQKLWENLPQPGVPTAS